MNVGRDLCSLKNFLEQMDGNEKDPDINTSSDGWKGHEVAEKIEEPSNLVDSQFIYRESAARMTESAARANEG